MSAPLNPLLQRLADKPLPVRRAPLDACLRLLKNDKRALSDLIPLLRQDPSLSALLLAHVNLARKRGEHRISTLQSAIGLLGHDSLERVLRRASVFETINQDSLAAQAFEQLILRGVQAATQVQHWAKQQKDRLPEELYLSALLRPIGELMLCAYDFPSYCKILTLVHEKNLPDSVAETQVLGQPLRLLALHMGHAWKLSQETLQCMDPINVFNFRSMGVLLACESARLAERGWYSPAMRYCTEQAAEYLKRDSVAVTQAMHQSALSAARHLPGQHARAAAAYLLLPPGCVPPTWLPNKKAAKPPAPSAKTQAKPAQAPRAIINVQQAQTANEVLQGLIGALKQDIQLQRILFMKLGGDKNTLTTRLAVGFAVDTTVQRVKPTLNAAPLFKQLLQKPLAARIKHESYLKLSPGLPAALLQALGSKEFMLMSLFVGNKPIGLLLADADGAVVSDAQYTHYKAYCGLASKKLTQLSQPPRAS